MSDKKIFAQLIGDLAIINVPTHIHDYIVNNISSLSILCQYHLTSIEPNKGTDGNYYYELIFKKSIYRTEYWKVYQLLYNCPKFY